MANHGWVDTKKPMTPEDIAGILMELNQRLFQGHLTVEYSSGEEGDWGDHTWLVKYVSDGTEWAVRACWLDNDNPHHFEMRHGGGSQFAWWLDSAILNEVAVKFDGIIGDDGVEETWPGEAGKYDDYIEYLKRTWGHNKHLMQLIENEKMFGPPEFR